MLDTGRGDTGQGLEIVPFMAAHLMMLNEQDTEKYWGDVVKTPGYARQLEKAGPAHTAMRDGKVLACIGLMEQWPGRATAWAIMAQEIGGADYLAIHRAVLRFVKLIGYRRIDATVAANFPNAIRWAKLLGFKCETPEPMQGYDTLGNAHYLFSRVAL